MDGSYFDQINGPTPSEASAMPGSLPHLLTRWRLQFELPTSPTADDFAAVFNARSSMDLEMSKEGEDMKWAKEQ
jgi:hypothetical protein